MNTRVDKQNKKEKLPQDLDSCMTLMLLTKKRIWLTKNNEKVQLTKNMWTHMT
jgi:hypothetical protein